MVLRYVNNQVPCKCIETQSEIKATVVEIGALTKNHCEYITCPFLISATCKGKDTIGHMEFLHLSLGACSHKENLIKGKVYSVASDGESRQGKALALLMEHFLLFSSSPLYVHLGNLLLLNLMVGEDEITSDKDYKHVMKRLQHVHLHPNGILIG